MEKTLEELDILSKEYGFGGAHNAITCAKVYREAYSEYLSKYRDMEKVFNSLKEVLPLSVIDLLNKRLEENRYEEN